MRVTSTSRIRTRTQVRWDADSIVCATATMAGSGLRPPTPDYAHRRTRHQRVGWTQNDLIVGREPGDDLDLRAVVASDGDRFQHHAIVRIDRRDVQAVPAKEQHV